MQTQTKRTHRFQNAVGAQTRSLERNPNAPCLPGHRVCVTGVRKANQPQTLKTHIPLRRNATETRTPELKRNRFKTQPSAALSCPHMPDQTVGIAKGCKHCQARANVSLIRQSAWHCGIRRAQCLNAAHPCAPSAEPSHKVHQGLGAKVVSWSMARANRSPRRPRWRIW